MAEPGVAVAPRGAPTRQKAGPRMKREKVKPRSRQLPLHTEASSERAQVQKAARRMQKTSYLVFSLASSTLMTGLVILATYYRFYLQQETAGEELPWEEMLSTALLTAGSAIGMEFWARWAHRALWHGSMWELDEKLRVGMLKPIEELHKSHHKPRKGAFEANDIFAVINGVPATSLCAYGFFHSGIVGGLAFGAGLGITLYGIAYMFVHDGLVHRRFPVGPISEVPQFQRLKAAHKIHHDDTFSGVPFGLFLAEQELREVGGIYALDAMLERERKKSAQSSA